MAGRRPPLEKKVEIVNDDIAGLCDRNGSQILYDCIGLRAQAYRIGRLLWLGRQPQERRVQRIPTATASLGRVSSCAQAILPIPKKKIIGRGDFPLWAPFVGYFGVRIEMRLPWGTGRMWLRSFVRRGLATLLNMPNALRNVPHDDSKPGHSVPENCLSACMMRAWILRRFGCRSCTISTPRCGPIRLCVNSLSVVINRCSSCCAISHCAKRCDSHEGDVFVNENPHLLSTSASSGVTCSSARDAT